MTTLRQRLIARNTGKKESPKRIPVPPVGRINEVTAARLQNIATRAFAGDSSCRDHLFFSLRPRLDRISWILRPWPNTPGMTGVWDRDDVRQESWIVFCELLDSWDGEMPFIPYLLARFPWRLRDRILRGIGKSQMRFGAKRIPEVMLTELLFASDAEQPESVAIARSLLEDLLRQHMDGTTSHGEVEAWIQLIHSRKETTLVSPEFLVDPPDTGRESNVA